MDKKEGALRCWGWSGVFTAVTTLLVLLSLYLVFFVVPSEATLGPVQRIFYFHVGCAFATYLMIAVIFAGSAWYLVTRSEQADDLARSAGPVACTFCTAVLFSGMIWGHSSWNTWWNWEPRLVSFLVLWLILFSYAIFRLFTKGHERQAEFAAVLGILAAVNVPIVIFSIKLLGQTEQLHPQVIANRGLSDLRFVLAFVLSAVSVCLAALCFLRLSYQATRLERRLQALEMDLR